MARAAFQFWEAARARPALLVQAAGIVLRAAAALTGAEFAGRAASLLKAAVARQHAALALLGRTALLTATRRAGAGCVGLAATRRLGAARARRALRVLRGRTTRTAGQLH